MFVTISSRCYFTLTWMAVRFVRRVHSSDYIDHLLIEKSWKGELAYADHYWPYCSDFTVWDFLQSWVCAWKAWFQDAKITAHRPEKTWAVIFNNQIISGEPSSVAPFLFIILASLHFYVNFLYKISFALWHATECPLAFFCLFLFHSGFFKRFIDNFYPVLLIGILYNFIAFQNLLCF